MNLRSRHLLAVSIALWANWNVCTAAEGDKPVTVGVHTVQADDSQRTVQATGQLIADEMIMLRAEVPGRILQLPFSEGKPVAAGHAMVILETGEQRARLSQLQAEERISEAQSRRTEALFRDGFLPEQNAIEAREKYAQSRARVMEAKAQLDKMIIRAPFPGVAGLRLVSPGAFLKEGEDIVTLSKLDPLKLDIRLPERYLNMLHRQHTLYVQVDAWPEQRFAGQIYAIDPTVDPATRTIQVRAKIANSQLRLKPGMFARTEIRSQQTNHYVRVPEAAVAPRSGRQLVYRIRDRRAEAVEVTLGERTPGWVQVIRGLAPGDVIVVEGHMKLRPGSRVTTTTQSKD